MRGIWTSRAPFQSTPSGGKATHLTATTTIQSLVSIHAFRGEGDRFIWRRSGIGQHVSIHAFRGEGDFNPDDFVTVLRCFNPRLPGGRRRVSTAALNWSSVFQSTPSGGKATFIFFDLVTDFNVSIHAFRGEGDASVPPIAARPRCFNPRLPGGRRLSAPTATCSSAPFQSTPSGGKATHSYL